jgi:hypothetical protein
VSAQTLGPKMAKKSGNIITNSNQSVPRSGPGPRWGSQGASLARPHHVGITHHCEAPAGGPPTPWPCPGLLHIHPQTPVCRSASLTLCSASRVGVREVRVEGGEWMEGFRGAVQIICHRCSAVKMKALRQRLARPLCNALVESRVVRTQAREVGGSAGVEGGELIEVLVVDHRYGNEDDQVDQPARCGARGGQIPQPREIESQVDVDAREWLLPLLPLWGTACARARI